MTKEAIIEEIKKRFILNSFFDVFIQRHPALCGCNSGLGVYLGRCTNHESSAK